jgi:two-component system response regulator HydG
MREHPGHEPAADAAMPATDGTRTLEEMEKEAIVATLDAADGNKSEAARRLGISRKTLHNKLKAYGLG